MEMEAYATRESSLYSSRLLAVQLRESTLVCETHGLSSPVDSNGNAPDVLNDTEIYTLVDFRLSRIKCSDAGYKDAENCPY
ncbi:hypothetical protein NMY22_g8279 [Coprinellus aureogranulatus]|nr:hypothetical protein NMY22_g8279 [Coprinellus aureogranulatus]